MVCRMFYLRNILRVFLLCHHLFSERRKSCELFSLKCHSLGNYYLLATMLYFLRTLTLFLDMLCIGEHIRFLGYVNQWNMYNMHMAIGVIYEIQWLIFTITSSRFCNEWIVSLEYIGFFYVHDTDFQRRPVYILTNTWVPSVMTHSLSMLAGNKAIVAGLHIYSSLNRISLGSSNGLPDWHQGINRSDWKFRWYINENTTFFIKQIHLLTLSPIWLPFCSGFGGLIFPWLCQ